MMKAAAIRDPKFALQLAENEWKERYYMGRLGVDWAQVQNRGHTGGISADEQARLNDFSARYEAATDPKERAKIAQDLEVYRASLSMKRGLGPGMTKGTGYTPADIKGLVDAGVVTPEEGRDMLGVNAGMDNMIAAALAKLPAKGRSVPAAPAAKPNPDAANYQRVREQSPVGVMERGMKGVADWWDELELRPPEWMDEAARLRSGYASGGLVSRKLNTNTSVATEGASALTPREAAGLVRAIARERQPVPQDMDLMASIARRIGEPTFAAGGRVNMQHGGDVNGPGSETSDSIPARLSDGEYVLNAEAVRMIGKDRLDELNQMGLHARGYALTAHDRFAPTFADSQRRLRATGNPYLQA